VLLDFVCCNLVKGANVMLHGLVQLCERLPSPNGESTVDCKTLSSMPNVSFTIAGKSFELAPEEVSIY
jgi:hypothetical protein